VFQDILAAGGSFVSNGYNRTLSTSYSNPLGGRSAWSGTSTNYVTTIVNLPAAAAGQNIQLRWRCGSDSSVSSNGWFIDTLSIKDATCCSASANVAPVINAATIQPVSPATTNNLFAAVTDASDANGDSITFGYQWQESTTNLAGQTASILSSALTFAGGSYRCVITPNDGKINGSPFVTSAVLVPLDANANGLNDDWEVANFGLMGVDPIADADGDGFSNLMEETAGTNPNSSASLPAITAITRSGDDVLITFSSVAGKNYQVSRCSDLPSAGWSAVTNLTATGSATQVTDPNAAAAALWYYRVKLLP
jgi:hypothetical protein